jgi:hypothetical protein
MEEPTESPVEKLSREVKRANFRKVVCERSFLERIHETEHTSHKSFVCSMTRVQDLGITFLQSGVLRVRQNW